ncbi:MAG: LacI family transcriptional regulator [Paenibacillus sp.]|jgi:DNA-binding LacI/PurR family transcriptional regulator|nr:LacI family transcriptional regulator [Paenibacillus sp.]
MDKNITMQDIADHLKLDRTTVSKAISGKGSVSAKTITRVKQAIEELGYLKDNFASGLVTGKNTVLAVVLPEIKSGINASFVQSFQRTARKHRYGVILYYVEPQRNNLPMIFEMLKQQRVSGVTFLSAATTTAEDESLIRLLDSGIAINTTSRSFIHERIDGIRFNHIKAGFELTEYFIKLQHTNIVFVSNTLNQGTPYERMEGYKKAMQSYGLQPVIIGDAQCGVKPSDYPSLTKYAYHMMLQKWDSVKDATAFIGCNDDTALGVMHMLKEQNISIPSRCSVAGFDDLYADVMIPQLTSMRFPLSEGGEKAAELLLKRISANEKVHTANFLLDYELIDRESTGICPLR